MNGWMGKDALAVSLHTHFLGVSKFDGKVDGDGDGDGFSSVVTNSTRQSLSCLSLSLSVFVSYMCFLTTASAFQKQQAEEGEEEKRRSSDSNM